MNKSESIANLAQALSKFQGQMTNPKNTAKNPQFNSKYAPLQDILALARPLLSEQGLSLLQSTTGDLENVAISTMLMHESGEYLETDSFVLRGEQSVKGGGKVLNVQGAGSMITYIRRYQVSAILGIASEDDDDGNNSSGHQQQGQQRPVEQKPIAQKPVEQKPSGPIQWPMFWQGMKTLGYSESEVHAFAKVESLKEWSREMLDELVSDLRKAKANPPAPEVK